MFSVHSQFVVGSCGAIGTGNQIPFLRRVALRPQANSVKGEGFQNKPRKRKVFKKNRKNGRSSALSEDLEGLHISVIRD